MATCIEHDPTAGFSDGETTLSTAGTPALTTLNRLMAQPLRKLLSFLTRTFGIAGWFSLRISATSATVRNSSTLAEAI
jgi:hypothetical protein